jgi:hypothetical protein
MESQREALIKRDSDVDRDGGRDIGRGRECCERDR